MDEKEIALLNSIINEAVYYGGDSGGPYCTDPDDVISYMNEYLTFKNVSGVMAAVVRVGINDIPQFVKIK